MISEDDFEPGDKVSFKKGGALLVSPDLVFTVEKVYVGSQKQKYVQLVENPYTLGGYFPERFILRQKGPRFRLFDNDFSLDEIQQAQEIYDQVSRQANHR